MWCLFSLLTTSGQLLCRTCLRREDEELLGPSVEEQKGLEELAKVLDNVSWTLPLRWETARFLFVGPPPLLGMPPTAMQ